jgi:hypothetical protein
MVAKQESDNSEDPQFIARVNSASDQVQGSKYFIYGYLLREVD